MIKRPNLKIFSVEKGADIQTKTYYMILWQISKERNGHPSKGGI
jgi:hypothetical protein